METRLAIICTSAAFALACVPQSTQNDVETATAQQPTLLKASHACVIDTIQLTGAVELGADLQASLDARFVQHPAGGYPHVYLAQAFETPIVPTEEFGVWIYSFHGWDVVPRDLATPSFGPTQGWANAPDGLYAVLDGTSGATQPFDANRYATAKAIFEAMTRATQTTTDHVVAQPAYDFSWTRVRRASPHNRLVCDKITVPGSGPATTRYRCVLSNVQWKTVQAYDPRDAANFCAGR